MISMHHRYPRRGVIVGAVVGILLTCFANLQAATVTLESLLNGNGEIVVGDKQFDEFGYLATASSTKRFGQDRLGRHGARDYLNLPPNVIAIDAKLHANSDATAGLRDRRGGQVSVHSSHRYHPAILSDVVQVLSSVDRDQIPARQIVDDPDLPGRSNHYQLIA